jgi:hypothetical protein
VVAMFNYTHRGFSWDLGYNFWGMSCSKISCPDNCPDECNDSCNPIIVPFPTNMALKGDASVAGCTGTAVFGLGATEMGGTSSSTLGATIFNGANARAASALATPGNPYTNLAVDNAVAASGNVGGTTPTALNVCSIATATPIFTSSTPIFITLNDLDIDGARQRGISNKVFTHFSYTWTDCDRWTPYFGGGFSAEFGNSGCGDNCSPTTTTSTTTSTTTTTNNNNCSSCKNCALSQWGVEIKGGVNFH